MTWAIVFTEIDRWIFFWGFCYRDSRFYIYHDKKVSLTQMFERCRRCQSVTYAKTGAYRWWVTKKCCNFELFGIAYDPWSPNWNSTSADSALAEVGCVTYKNFSICILFSHNKSALLHACLYSLQSFWSSFLSRLDNSNFGAVRRSSLPGGQWHDGCRTWLIFRPNPEFG